MSDAYKTFVGKPGRKACEMYAFIKKGNNKIDLKKIRWLKALIKPIWSYGIELWGCASKSNIFIMQRFQSKILRAIANKCNKSYSTHRLEIPYVSDVVRERINKHHNKPEAHPNPLLEPLLQPSNTRRQNRSWPLDLQGTWGDIAGWIPKHIIEIHGIMTYFV